MTLTNGFLLLLAPLAALLVFAISRRSTRILPPWRRGASIAVRSLAVILLAMAMAQPVLTARRVRPLLTVFVADASESIPAGAWDEALDPLRRLWDREIAAGGRCALVAFAGRADVLVPPTHLPLEFDPARLVRRVELENLSAAAERGDASAALRLADLRRWTDRIQTSATDLARGLDTARSLFIEDSENRIVLLTDGRDTSRPANEIPLPPETLAVRLEGPARPDVAIVDVQAPLAVRTGEPFDVRVTVQAAQPSQFMLSMTIDDVAPAADARPRFHVPAGRSVVVLENVQQKLPLAPGLHRVFVMTDTPGDAEPRNNAGAAVVSVTGRPRVLLAEGVAGEAEPLAKLLRAQDIDLVREPLTGTLEEFAAVVLAGVPREALGAEVVQALTNYVEVSGGGLWVVGSPSLQADRSYAKSDFEKILPVAFTGSASGGGAGAATPGGGTPRPDPDAPPQRVLAPTVAMLFIVDKSGSMAGDSIALVKEACIESAKVLSARDLVGVLAFDVRPLWVLRFTDADRHSYIQDSILRLFADGGTHIQPALVDALNAFRTDPRARRAGVKHAILLSDGDTQPADLESVAREMAADGITVTAVCVGSATTPKFDPILMSGIARAGGGRFIFAGSFREVPKIFSQETHKAIQGTGRAAGPSTPALPPDPPASTGSGDRSPIAVAAKDEHEILQGLDRKSIPPLRGLLGAAARPTASVPLATVDGRPVLALWRVGLGKVAVWTSDLSGRWNTDWAAWPSSGKLFAQLVRHLSSAAPDAELAARVRVTMNGAQAVLRIDPGDDVTAMSSLTRRPLALERGPDGGAHGVVPLERAGETHPILLQRASGKNLLVGAVRSCEPEFAPVGDLFSTVARAHSWRELETALSGDRMSGDRRTDLSLWLIAAVVLLLPIDVALRRYNA